MRDRALIGDKITPQGYSYKMMVVLNERHPDVTFRFLFIKSATIDTLFKKWKTLLCILCHACVRLTPKRPSKSYDAFINA